MIRLSIVVPVYKVEKYIRKTLESIYSQGVDENEFEVIIINDGTPDQSMSIVKEFKQEYSNLKVFEQENQGLSVARNHGLLQASGDYVWFVDSDDWMEPGFLPKFLSDIKINNSPDVFIFNIKHVNENGDVVSDSNQKIKEMKIVRGCDIILGNYPFVPMQQYIVKRFFLINNELFYKPGIFHEDVEFAPRMLYLSESVMLIPVQSYCYLIRESGSITSDDCKLKKRNSDLMDIFDDFYERAINSNSLLENKYWYKNCLFVLEILFSKKHSKTWMDFISFSGTNHLKKFKFVVFKNLFDNPKLNSIIRKLIFIFAPSCLKYINKGLY